HVPGRTGQFLSAEVLGSVCENRKIACVKEASGDVTFFSRAKMRCGDISFLSGDDPTYLASLAVGGKGVISVVSNVYPRAMVQLQEAFERGDMATALRLHERLLPVIDILFCESNPGPSKAALHVMGLCQNKVRLPLAEVTAPNYKRIEDELKRS